MTEKRIDGATRLVVERSTVWRRELTLAELAAELGWTVTEMVDAWHGGRLSGDLGIAVENEADSLLAQHCVKDATTIAAPDRNENR